MSKPDEIAKVVIDELLDRGGFDHWWHEIDKELQKEILITLASRINTVLLNR